MKRLWHAAFAEVGPTAGQRRSLARALLLLTIGALCLAALVAIGILLFGNFGETEGKILLTVVAIAGYSLLGLAATTALGRGPGWLGPLGVGVSAVGFILFVGLIWIAPEGSLLGRLMGTFLILAVAIAHAALLLLLTRRTSGGPVGTVRRATLAASAVLTGMIVVPILTEWEPSGIYVRLLGTIAVLAALGTLLVPILWKLTAGADAQKGQTAGEAKSDSAGTVSLELRYRGRIFTVEATERGRPTPGFAVVAWEVTSAGREPVALLADQDFQEDSHIALASAVRQITAEVDRDDRTTRPLAEERLPAEDRAMPRQWVECA
jgi:hypothetical protein